jgi:hypothetical protein
LDNKNSRADRIEKSDQRGFLLVLPQGKTLEVFKDEVLPFRQLAGQSVKIPGRLDWDP